MNALEVAVYPPLDSKKEHIKLNRNYITIKHRNLTTKSGQKLISYAPSIL